MLIKCPCIKHQCQFKQGMRRVISGSAHTVTVVGLQQKGERGTNDPAGCLRYTIQLVLFRCCAAVEQGSEAVV